MDLPNNLLDLTPENLQKYCVEKGKRFALGDEKTNKDGKKYYINKVTTSQLRNFFSKIISIRTAFQTNKYWDENNECKITMLKKDLILLRPTLAYAKGKNDDLINFQREVDNLIEKTIITLSQSKNADEIKNTIEIFLSIIEGFVAYHKFYGGKE